jgi:prophage regulatory protein
MAKTEVIHASPIFVARDKAAAALGIGERTLEGLVAAGELPPPRKISAGRVGWLWRELLEFAESRPVSDLAPGPGRRAAPADQPAG